jgi:hypothetical protein
MPAILTVSFVIPAGEFCFKFVDAFLPQGNDVMGETGAHHLVKTSQLNSAFRSFTRVAEEFRRRRIALATQPGSTGSSPKWRGSYRTDASGYERAAC